MKKVVLRKWAESVVVGITGSSIVLLISINDFNLAAAPVLFGLLIVAGLGCEILSKYGR